MSNEKKRPSFNESLRQYAQYTSLGFQMLIVILIGVFAGRQLDRLYPNDKGWFTITLSLFAVVASLIYVILKLIKESR